MLVRNCVAHDGKRAPIQLVDELGCVTRPKIMSKFQKIKNFGSSASVVSYAYFQAFKFPDSMNVHFQCVVQVCRSQCPQPQCGNALPAPAPSTNRSLDSTQNIFYHIIFLCAVLTAMAPPLPLQSMRTHMAPPSHLPTREY